MARQNGPRSIGGEANLAERIAYEREQIHGWSYETLARKMSEAGCSIQGSAIFKIEKGTPRRRVTVDELIALSRVFDVPVEELLTPMALLKQDWANQKARELVEADREIKATVAHLVELWSEVLQADLSDVLEGADDDESTLTYVTNLFESSRDEENSAFDGTATELHNSAIAIATAWIKDVAKASGAVFEDDKEAGES